MGVEAQLHETLKYVSFELIHAHGFTNNETFPYILALLFIQVNGDFLLDEGRGVYQILGQSEISLRQE